MEEEKSILENLIEICIKEQKELLDEDGETYTEEDVRLTVMKICTIISNTLCRMWLTDKVALFIRSSYNI